MTAIYIGFGVKVNILTCISPCKPGEDNGGQEICDLTKNNIRTSSQLRATMVDKIINLVFQLL